LEGKNIARRLLSLSIFSEDYYKWGKNVTGFKNLAYFSELSY